MSLAKSAARRIGSDSDQIRRPSCPSADQSFYSSVCKRAAAEGSELAADELHFRARRVMWSETSVVEMVPMICDGWAAASITLPNGRRQILSFLLPGDIVSTALVFRPQLDYRVEAITDVRCRAFDRAQLRSFLLKDKLFDTLAAAWVEEKAQAEQLIVDLGRRGAEERVARLILNLLGKLERRGLIERHSATFEFPLRQHHIADATGLTTVYVSGIMTAFRDAGLIEAGGRSLTVTNLEGLKHAASD